MNFELLHPADQLVLMMNRIYKGGMTTTSGGNLSILDENGDIWITPSGIDKGTSTLAICAVSNRMVKFSDHTNHPLSCLFMLLFIKAAPICMLFYTRIHRRL